MMYRSLLFVPGDSERKIAKAETVAPDAVILDLEDAVAPAKKADARQTVAAYLASSLNKRPRPLFVRINPLSTPEALDDLAAIMAGAPDGIVQPKAGSPAEVRQLGHYLDALEAANGLARAVTKILPVATETPQALFALHDYVNVGPRLAALTWGAEDLGAAVGSITSRTGNGGWSAPYELARSLCLFAAAAADVAAIDTVFVGISDLEGLAASARQARRDGFRGKVAIHPDQVETINEAFTPSAEEIAQAQQIVDAFAANPGLGALRLEGRMIDIPHLVQARKTLAFAKRT